MRISSSSDTFLDGAISKEEQDSKRQKFKSRQIELANQLNSYHMADDGFSRCGGSDLLPKVESRGSRVLRVA